MQNKWDSFCNDLRKTKLLVTEGIGKTFPEIFEITENVNPVPKVVILDYVQAIKISSRDERLEIDEYLRQFRQYAIEKGFCGIVCSQINRVGLQDDKKPALGNLKSTGKLEEFADKVFLLHWDYFYNKQAADPSEYLVSVAKNRNGRTGIHKIRFSPEFYSFEEQGEIQRNYQDKD